MSLDPCQLTADVLPLLADDLLSPETRQFVLAHAAGCPACSRLLAAARAGEAAPVLDEPEDSGWAGSPEASARRFFWRLGRLAVYGLVLAVLLMIGVGSFGYRLGRRSSWELEQIPPQVASADDLARRAVPGWSRAEAQGLLVPLGITEHIPKTDATITLDKAWYSGQQVYVLYTVQAPAGQLLVPTASYLMEDIPQGRYYYGGTDWAHLSRWGGFSRAGFHAVFSFARLDPPPHSERVKLAIKQWATVSPKTGPSREGPPVGGEVNAFLPWRAEYLQEPAPVGFDLTARHTWLGRTLSLERLEVGTGRMVLSGWIDLPTGEANPYLFARLQIGNSVRELKDYSTEPGGAPGRYRFRAVFEGPDAWPQPVSLELTGIGFQAQRNLEWTFPWARYRDQSPDWRRTLDQAEQFEVRFYDSTLTTIGMTADSVAIAQKDTTAAPPYVTASLAIGGRLDESSPGMEIAGPDGPAVRNLGGGGGNVWSDGSTNYQGVAARWDVKMFPQSFRDASRLTLRYVRPSATLMLKETWQLLPVK